jgi:hypothetical protein
VLAVAVACALAGARNFREAGDHAAGLPQEILARLGGRPHPLLRKITAPGETRIRTLIHAVSADLLDDLIGGWLRALADSGRLDEALTAIAVDGKWLRGVLDGQVKLIAAMLHEEKVIIAQHRIPDETTETTQASGPCTGPATPPAPRTRVPDTPETAPQVMATLRNLAISLLRLSGVTEITRTLQAIARDRNRILDYLPP